MLLGIVAVLVVAFVVATLVLFVRPSTDAPRRVDAVVVLGGSGDRVAKGLTLARAGYAPVLVVSDHDQAPCPASWPGVRVLCFDPDPASTQGEAEDVARLAARHHWESLLVVPSVPQTTRARIRFDRCYHGTVLFDPSSPGGVGEWLYNLAYEWGALTKAMVWQRSC